MGRHHSILPTHRGKLICEIILPGAGKFRAATARALGVSRQTLYEILNERQSVTAEMALRFGTLFGNGAEFWSAERAEAGERSEAGTAAAGAGVSELEEAGLSNWSNMFGSSSN